VIITGYSLVVLFLVVGYYLHRHRGSFWIGSAAIFIAGLAFSATLAGPHLLDGVQTATNGVSTGISQATHR
jgi:hypothetical protein